MDLIKQQDMTDSARVPINTTSGVQGDMWGDFPIDCPHCQIKPTQEMFAKGLCSLLRNKGKKTSCPRENQPRDEGQRTS